MKKAFFILYIVFCASQLLFSQGEIDEQKKIFYRNERSFAFMLNSNGIGFNSRYSVRRDAFRKSLYDIELVTLKHPKEYRMISQYSTSSRGYVLGKLNSVFVLRAGIGKQKEIFQKFDVGGISIRRFYTFGPSLAFLKPVYYEVLPVNSNYTVIQKFDINSSDQVIGRASFFRGFDEISLKPGAFVKGGICFEFSKYDQIIHAVEGGAIFEAYPSKIPIMATKQNYQFFITLFISYRFGKVIDTFHPNNDADKEGEFNY